MKKTWVVAAENSRARIFEADYLDKARANRRFDQLVLIAAPEFLGLVRKHLSPATLKLLSRAVSKNLVRADEPVIRQTALELA